MNPIVSAAKPMFAELVKPIGFQGKKTISGYSFYRLMDGFVQGFKIYAMNYHASIRFFTFPLCGGIDLRYEGDDISWFWGNSCEFINVESLSCEEAQRAAESLLGLFKKYLLPWFTDNNTVEKAYKADVDLYFSYKMSQLSGDTELERKIAMSASEIYYPMKKFYWMMQMNEYEKALKFLKLRINQLESYPGNIPYLSELKEDYIRIAAFDMDYIEHYITNNSEKTLINLKLKRAKVWEG